LLRSAPSANVVVTRLSAAGERIAAPRPCRARGDQRAAARCQAAREGRDGEEREARHEDPPAAEQVGHPPTEQQEPAERQHVRVDQPGEALAPARMARLPAQLGLRLGVGGAAGLGHHRHRGRARDDLGDPRRDLARGLGADLVGQVGQPLLGGCGLVVDDVVVDLAGAAVLDRRQGRGGDVVGVQEGPDALAVPTSGNWRLRIICVCSPPGAIPVPGPWKPP
jgi:hypothetical protein